MKDFKSKIAVVTGAGTGMGRALACQLASEGCHVAICDFIVENMNETKRLCEEVAPPGTRITAHECDVSDEVQVAAFRDAVKQQQDTDCINLLFNNAGVNGGSSFIVSDRREWDRTFAIDWSGVYYNARAFMPMLLASTEGCIVNTSSVEGFWACLGPQTPMSAYGTAKFAVKGFTEALQIDLRLNAPHVKAFLVMPGHIGTSIVINAATVLGNPGLDDMTSEELESIRTMMKRHGMDTAVMTDDEIRAVMKMVGEGFRDNAPVSSKQAAAVILDGIRRDQWRILVGEDAHNLDQFVRANPEDAYEESAIQKMQAADDWNLDQLIDQSDE
ncbi:MAG: SDR family oxidoreductase [Proteobacteria bacterium]|nr:SDR family oxidoreductase [Pseudomonadota bacterium]